MAAGRKGKGKRRNREASTNPVKPPEAGHPVAVEPGDSARWRWLLNVVIVGYLVVQVVLPLSYYLWRNDAYDERFAWRMFSSIRLYSCRSSVHEVTVDGHDRDVSLRREIHQAWINHLARNRRDVIKGLLERRCEEDDVHQVVLRNDCVRSNGQPIDPLTYRMDCNSGAFDEPERVP